MAIHKAEVIRVGRIEDHPNADRLGIVKHKGFTFCVGLDDFKEGDLGVYIEPDSVVSDDERFAFLGDKKRIRVRRFRGVLSQGLLMPAPLEAEEGEDYMEEWDIQHYEPPLPLSCGGDNEKGPGGWFPYYDVESFNRFPDLFEAGERVIVTEKIHGASARCCFMPDQETGDYRMFVSSHSSWKKRDDKNLYWQALNQTPAVEAWCKAHPNLVVYAEVYGQVQELKYGTKKNEVRIAAFDVLKGNQWLSWDESQAIVCYQGLPWVPVLYIGPFDEVRIRALAEQDSRVQGADHQAEGIVVRPVIERTHLDIGRVQLKIVSNNYLEGKKEHKRKKRGKKN